MENDTAVLEQAADELADNVALLGREGAVEVLWALYALLERLESGKVGRNGQLVR
jgi:hypothetical protein